MHGFTQTAVSWAPVVERLRHEAVAPEVPSDLGLWDTAGALAEQAGCGIWVGYSMGGRIALHVALAHPSAVTGLVLVSATAGIDDDAERSRRREADDALAARVESIGAEAFLDEWLAEPLLHGAPADRDARSHDASALARSLRRQGTGTQEPLWDRLGEITAPVLVVVGERDTKYLALADRLAAALPRAERSVIADAGHTCHLEQPDAFVAVLDDWLGRHPDSASPAASSTP